MVTQYETGQDQTTDNVTNDQILLSQHKLIVSEKSYSNQDQDMVQDQIVFTA